MLVVALLNGPRPQRDIHASHRRFRLAQRTAADPLRNVELSGREVADREVAEVKIAHGPFALRLRGGELHALAKERELVAEFARMAVLHVAREVPPLGFEIRMRPVIARKLHVQYPMARCHGASEAGAGSP